MQVLFFRYFLLYFTNHYLLTTVNTDYDYDNHHWHHHFNSSNDNEDDNDFYKTITKLRVRALPVFYVWGEGREATTTKWHQEQGLSSSPRNE